MTEQLIEKVKKYRILYDLSHPQHKNVRKRDKVWDDIGKALGEDGKHIQAFSPVLSHRQLAYLKKKYEKAKMWEKLPNVVGETMKKRWKNLRDCYSKHLRSKKIHTGEKSKTLDRYKTWPWAEEMAAFKPFLQFTRTVSNTTNAEPQLKVEFIDDKESRPEEEITEEKILKEEEGLEKSEDADQSKNVDIQQFWFPEEDLEVPISTTSRKSIIESSSVEKILSYLQEQEKLPTTVYDDVDLICLGYAKTIKKFSPRRQIMAKFKIAQLLMEEELAQEAENRLSIPKSTETSSTISSTAACYTFETPEY